MYEVGKYQTINNTLFISAVNLYNMNTPLDRHDYETFFGVAVLSFVVMTGLTEIVSAVFPTAYSVPEIIIVIVSLFLGAYIEILSRRMKINKPKSGL